MGGSSGGSPALSLPSLPSVAGGDYNPFSNVKNWAANLGAGRPGSQGDGGQPMNVPNPVIDATSPFKNGDGNSPWSPIGTQPTMGTLFNPLNSADPTKLAPGLGETDHLDQTQLDQLKDMTSPDALKSDSPWAQSQFNQIDRNTQTMRDAAQANMAASVQGASDAAATHGGLTGGGAARIGAMGMMNEANGSQAAGLYGAQAKDQTRAQDYATKVGILDQLPQQNLNAANYQSGVEGYNTNAVMGGERMANEGTLTKYGQDMNNYIGQNLANAIGNTGKRKGIGG